MAIAVLPTWPIDIKSLAAILALAIIFMTPLSQAQIQILDRVAAIVDDDVILESELSERIDGVRMTMQNRGVEVPEDEILVRETLDRLILDSIQLQLADRFGVRIPDAQLDDSMSRLAQQNGLDLSQFRQALKESGQSYDVIREKLRTDMLIQRVQQGNVMRNISTSEQEIDNFLATEEGEALTQAEYRIIQALLPISKTENLEEIAKKEAYIDGLLDEIRAGKSFDQAVSSIEFYTLEGGDLGWRKLGDIPSMFVDVVPSLDVGEVTKIRSSSGFHIVYLADAAGIQRLVRQTKVRHILITPTEVLDELAAESLAHELRQRILSGESFTTIAKAHSDDIGSAAEGGELGWTNPGQMVTEFEGAMANAEEGTLSEPFRSEFGWHVLEVQGRRDKDFSGEIKRNQIANHIREQKYQEELEAWLRKIREEAFVDIK